VEDIEKQIRTLENALAKGRLRTPQDFVMDMVNRRRTLLETVAVAANTRWKGHIEKVKEIYGELTCQR